MSKKSTIDALRNMYIDNLVSVLEGAGEEPLRVSGNEIAIPVVDGEGEDAFVVFKVQVPSGSRDGDIYDGYSMAQDYTMKQEAKAAKAAKAAEAKAKKIARDQAMREAKRAAKEAREG